MKMLSRIANANVQHVDRRICACCVRVLLVACANLHMLA